MSSEQFKYLTSENTSRLARSNGELLALIRVAEGIEDKALAQSIIAKAKQCHATLNARYAEIHNDDGSVLVKHPAIGFITVDEALHETPIRLFAAKSRSLSSNRVRLYSADALILKDGNVSYVNRVLLVDVEMTQMAFANLIASPGSGYFPATLRELDGQEITYDGDMNQIRGQIMFNSTQESTEEIAQWATKLVKAAQEATAKGGVMSKTARADMDKDAKVLMSWAVENPPHYAKMLAEFTSNTAAEMKLEIMAAANLQGSKK